jgi:hypothetical protein
MYIELEDVGPQRQAEREGGQGVLGSQPGGAAMPAID